MGRFYETADDWVNERDDAISEAAAARGRDPSLDHGGSTPWHRMLIAAARRHSVWVTFQDDGRVHLSEFGTKVFLAVFDDEPSAISYIDRLPVKPMSERR